MTLADLGLIGDCPAGATASALTFGIMPVVSLANAGADEAESSTEA